MDETPREKWAGIFGGVVSIIPAMIVAGFMPEWDVLPFAGWLAIAGVGAAIAGVIIAPSIRGALAGALAGVGLVLGVASRPGAPGPKHRHFDYTRDTYSRRLHSPRDAARIEE